MKPFAPLHTILPSYVIDYVKRNPDNSMSFYEGIDQRTKEPCLQFFIKCSSSDAQYVIDSPAIQARLSLFERQNDPHVGHAVFAGIEYLETQFRDMGEFSYAIVEGDIPTQFRSESEFPIDRRDVMKVLKYLVKQPWWTFIYVSNDCKTFFNAKEFNNPLTPEEKKEWLYKIRDWMK